MIVEFFGVMGGGKSTVKENLFNGERRIEIEGVGIYEGESRCYEFLEGRRSGRRGAIKKHLASALFLVPDIKRRYLNRQAVYNEFGMHMGSRRLSEFVIANYRGVPGDPKKAFHRMGSFVSCLGLLSAVTAMGNEEVHVFDEFLLQRCVSFALHNNDFKYFVKNYIELMPPSDLIVFVSVPLVVALERAGSRRGMVHSSEEVVMAHEIQEYIQYELLRRGFDVLQLDGETPVNESSGAVLRKIRSMRVQGR